MRCDPEHQYLGPAHVPRAHLAGRRLRSLGVAWAANGRRPILVTFIGRRNIALLLLAVLDGYLYLFKAFQAENSYENGNTFLLFTDAVFFFLKLIHLS